MSTEQSPLWAPGGGLCGVVLGLVAASARRQRIASFLCLLCSHLLIRACC